MMSDKPLLEVILAKAGKKLLNNPPSDAKHLISLLDQIESCLMNVEQCPPKSMQEALAPSMQALISHEIFGHSNTEVKVVVASCISELTRITAPAAPYDDDKMRDVFELIVSMFETLDDQSNQSYSKRVMILETVAQVRSCVMMLDLECDALLVKMFQHFLNAIRDDHPEYIFTFMVTIMSLVLEESERIPMELLYPLLNVVRRSNKGVLPMARKLGETVLENSAAKIKPYLLHAVKIFGSSIDMYSDVVTSICPEISFPGEENDAHLGDAEKQSVLGGADDRKDAAKKAVNFVAYDGSDAAKLADHAGADDYGKDAENKVIHADADDRIAVEPKDVHSGADDAEKQGINADAETVSNAQKMAINGDVKNASDAEKEALNFDADKTGDAEKDVVDANKVTVAGNKGQTLKKINIKVIPPVKYTDPSVISDGDEQDETKKQSVKKRHNNDAPSSPREDLMAYEGVIEQYDPGIGSIFTKSLLGCTTRVSNGQIDVGLLTNINLRGDVSTQDLEYAGCGWQSMRRLAFNEDCNQGYVNA